MCNAFRLSAISAAIILALTMNSSTDLLAQDIAVKQIIVNSRWGGLGTPAAANLTIASDGRGFDLAGRHCLVRLLHSRPSSDTNRPYDRASLRLRGSCELDASWRKDLTDREKLFSEPRV